jgi:indolepyruvate ferredoxin oxidoreductase
MGSKFEINFKNRPAIEIFGKSYELNISPKKWMFSIMRHLRFMRKLFPGWHAKDKQIGRQIRQEILEQVPNLSADLKKKRLEELDQIKGYRRVKYEKAAKVMASLKEIS